MENEGLRNTVVVGVVVKDCFEEWPWYYSPYLVHHFFDLMPCFLSSPSTCSVLLHMHKHKHKHKLFALSQTAMRRRSHGALAAAVTIPHSNGPSEWLDFKIFF